jgi:hypothetical protein
MGSFLIQSEVFLNGCLANKMPPRRIAQKRAYNHLTHWNNAAKKSLGSKIYIKSLPD